MIFPMIVRVHKCRPIMKLPILAWAIMIFQGMKPWKNESYSHMAISYMSITGEWKYADSTGKGVRDMVEKFFTLHYRIVDTRLLDLQVRPEEFLKWFEENEGKEYDRWQIVGLALKVLGIFSFNKYGANWRKLTCNELVLSLLTRFKGMLSRDSDDYDLVETWNEVGKYAIK